MITRATPEELAAIKIAMNKEKTARVFKRYQALYLFLSGKTCNEIADIIGITSATVCNLHKLYKNEGLAGIPDKLIPGRPMRLTLEQRDALKQVILTSVPADVGVSTDANWTAGLISKYIKREYGYDYSIRGITGMLERMGLSYIRPTYVLAKANKEKRERLVQDFETAEKLLNDEIQRILFEDEFKTRD